MSDPLHAHETDGPDTVDQLRQAIAEVEAGTSAPADSSSPGSLSDAATSSASAGETASPDPGPTGATASGFGEGEEYTAARAVVLRKLTGSPKTRHQLAQALRERETSEDIITAVLDRLEEVQLIDDAAFARTWVRTRHELKNLGSSVLRRELTDRGVNQEDTEAALEQLTVEDEESAAMAVIDRELQRVTVPQGHSPEERQQRDKITRRLVGKLGRRGHNPGLAFRLIREAMEAPSA